MNQIVLSSTLHDSEKRLYNVLPKAIAVIQKYYYQWVVTVTKTTHPDVKQSLKSLDATVIESATIQPLSSDAVENDHLTALFHAHRIAEQKNIPYVQYTDGDRVIMATNYFENDLKNTLKNIDNLLDTDRSEQIYINLRRDAQSYLAHHIPLVETEFEFNSLYSLAFGIPLDIGSTGHLMSHAVAAEILRKSPKLEIISFPHPKWLIIAKQMKASINSLSTKNIFTFETPLQFKKEVEDEMEKKGATSLSKLSEDINSYEFLQKAYAATLAIDGPMGVNSQIEWKRRIDLAQHYVTILSHHLASCIADPTKEAAVQTEIEKSLFRLSTLEKKFT